MKWLLTWQGLCTALAGAIVSTVGLLKLVPKLLKNVQKFYQGTIYLFEIKEGMERIERGLLDVIGTRRVVFSEDEVRGWWESDEEGQWQFSNRLVCAWLGLDERDTHGNGWQTGIVEEDRTRVMHAWEDAVLRQRGFDEHCTLSDRQGKRTRVRLVATPIFDTAGEAMSFKGRAIKEG